MRKLMICIAVCFIFLSSHAQEDIRNQILNYSDTTSILVKNGRRLIIDKIRSEDFESAVKTLDYLKNNTDKRYIILYPVEELLFSMATRSFQLFTYVAANFDNLLDNRVINPGYDNFQEDIKNYLFGETQLIKEDLAKANISEPDREMIKIYIDYYEKNEPELLNNAIKDYLKRYPDTEYKMFLSQLKSYTATGQLNFTLGYGGEFISGSIADYYDNPAHLMSFDMDIFVNKTYVSLYFAGSVSNITSKFDMALRKKDEIHQINEPVSSIRYGLKIGRTIIEKKNFKLYPFAAIGGYEMNSQSKLIEKDSNNPKNNISTAFYSGAGISCDISLITWQPKTYYNPASHLVIKPTVGYDKFLTGKEIAKGQNFYMTIALGWGIK